MTKHITHSYLHKIYPDGSQFNIISFFIPSLFYKAAVIRIRSYSWAAEILGQLSSTAEHVILSL